MSVLKVGIYGGTFSPPHIGHIKSAVRFQEELNLDKLIIIPSFIPPHKYFGGEASTTERLDMCRLAFGGIKNAVISDIEIARGGTSYSYLTLEELSEDRIELYMLIGTDMILTLDEWKYPEKIFKLTNICYIRRENNPETDSMIAKKINSYKENYDEVRISEIKCDVFEISSSEIRKMIADKDPSLYSYLTNEVIEYINRGGIYS